MKQLQQQQQQQRELLNSSNRHLTARTVLACKMCGPLFLLLLYISTFISLFIERQQLQDTMYIFSRLRNFLMFSFLFLGAIFVIAKNQKKKKTGRNKFVAEKYFRMSAASSAGNHTAHTESARNPFVQSMNVFHIPTISFVNKFFYR